MMTALYILLVLSVITIVAVVAATYWRVRRRIRERKAGAETAMIQAGIAQRDKEHP